MKSFVVLAAVLALSQSAVAQTPGCKSIADPTARLACYDKAFPVTASATAPSAAGAKPTRKSTTASQADGMQAQSANDAIGAEDAMVNAKLKNICRGC